VSNNLFDDLTSATWGTGSKAVQLGDGPQYVTIDHNTIITTDTTILALYGGPASAPTQIPHAVYTNNMSAHNSYGIFGSNFASGLSSINAYMPDAVVRRNVLAGCSASKYPTDNFCPSVVAWKPGFVNYAAGDYHLRADSPYKNAGTDGKDLGPDIDALNIQSAKALSGDNSTPPGTGGVTIITTALPNGVFQQSYSQSVVCTGGAGGCVWQQRDSSLPATTSSGLTCTRRVPASLFAKRTVPVSRYSTSSSLPISRGFFVVFLYVVELVRAMTASPGTFMSLPRTSSVMPSAK